MELTSSIEPKSRQIKKGAARLVELVKGRKIDLSTKTFKILTAFSKLPRV